MVDYFYHIKKKNGMWANICFLKEDKIVRTDTQSLCGFLKELKGKKK